MSQCTSLLHSFEIIITGSNICVHRQLSSMQHLIPPTCAMYWMTTQAHAVAHPFQHLQSPARLANQCSQCWWSTAPEPKFFVGVRVKANAINITMSYTWHFIYSRLSHYALNSNCFDRVHVSQLHNTADSQSLAGEGVSSLTQPFPGLWGWG